MTSLLVQKTSVWDLKKPEIGVTPPPRVGLRTSPSRLRIFLAEKSLGGLNRPVGIEKSGFLNLIKLEIRANRGPHFPNC